MANPLRLKRSRPEWLETGGERPLETGNPSPVNDAKPVQTDVNSKPGRTREPNVFLSERVRTSQGEGMMIPRGGDADSVIIRAYILTHQPSRAEFDGVAKLMDCISRTVKDQLEIAGAFGDGTASRRDSLNNVSICFQNDLPRDRLELLEIIMLAGPSMGWTAHNSMSFPDQIVITPMNIRDMRIHLYTKDCQTFTMRTRFVRVYTHLVDPCISVLVCFLRSRLPSEAKSPALQVDYFLFIIAWRVMVEGRLLPNLIPSESLFQTDIAYWSNDPSPTLKKWHMGGGHARIRKSIVDILSLIAKSLDIETIYSYNICPIDGSEIISDETLLPTILYGLTIPNS